MNDILNLIFYIVSLISVYGIIKNRKNHVDQGEYSYIRKNTTDWYRHFISVNNWIVFTLLWVIAKEFVR